MIDLSELAMKLSKTIQEYEKLRIWIRITKIPLYASYPLTILYVGIPLRGWAQRRLRDQKIRKAATQKKLQSFVQQAAQESKAKLGQAIQADTYLIYSQRNDLAVFFKEILENLQYLQSKASIFPEEFNLSVESCIQAVREVEIQINNYNTDFVARRKIEYKTLWTKSAVLLDDDQLTAIITDDKHNLVVAGAGSGKTEVLITRIAYLIMRKPDTVPPDRILALAFQNEAAGEVRKRLKERFRVDVKVKTFHALGKEILDQAATLNKEQPPKLKFSGDNFETEFSRFIKKLYLELQDDGETQNEIINYMKYYPDQEVAKEETDFETKKQHYEYMRSMSYTALDGTKVKSEAERQILNFFVMHDLNGKRIRIIYEDPAEWMTNTESSNTPRPDFHFPDHDLYLEHWAVNRKGRVPDWFEGDNPSKQYRKNMEWKKGQFKQQKKYGLIETYAWESMDSSFLDILRDRFVSALNEKFPNTKHILDMISYEQIVERVWEECRASVKSLAANIGRFIVIAKTHNLVPDNIRKRLNDEKWSRKQQSFASVALRVYEKYEKELRKEGAIDFADMINIAIQKLRANKHLYAEAFEHILIDEYQDISSQRYHLIKALMEKNPTCKLFCVGDDWQSIMSFTGANLDFFVRFGDYFANPATTYLTINYRSTRSVVDTGAHIIRFNGDAQLAKQTIAHNQTFKKVKVYSLLHQAEYKNNYYQQMVRHCVDKVQEYLRLGYLPGDIMILARIINSPQMRDGLLAYAQSENVPISIDGKYRYVPFMSVHRSKGLQARVVFILNVIKDLYGFPCELENPDIFEPAVLGRKKGREEEERRLFYVAVTRAKEDVYIYHQKCAPSKFIGEISDLADVEEVTY